MTNHIKFNENHFYNLQQLWHETYLHTQHAEWCDAHVRFGHEVKYTWPQASKIIGHINIISHRRTNDDPFITHKKVMLTRHFFHRRNSNYPGHCHWFATDYLHTLTLHTKPIKHYLIYTHTHTHSSNIIFHIFEEIKNRYIKLQINSKTSIQPPWVLICYRCEEN